MTGWQRLLGFWTQPFLWLESDSDYDVRQTSHVYATRLLQVHAAFRFFAFALGVGLLLVMKPVQLQPALVLTLAVVVGLADVARVILPPFRLSRRSPVETVLLTAELTLVLALVVVSGGIRSPFLVHSLSPVLCAALFLRWPGAVGLGSLAGIAVMGAHLLAPMAGWPLVTLLTGNTLAYLLLYLATTLLVVGLPFLSNINMERYRLLLARQDEYRRLRREVHDEVAQLLAFLSLKTQRMEERGAASSSTVQQQDLEDISQGVRRAYVAVRDYLEEGAINAEAGPLDARLTSLVDTWKEETGLAADLLLPRRLPDLSVPVRRHLLQIAREALVNAWKHGRASRVTVALERAEAEITLRVWDDGRGLLPGTPWGLGLNGMRERAALIGASFDIHSSPGAGAEVVVRLPLGPEGT